MRILVVSDTHGDLYSLMQAIKMQPNANIIVHCGDGEEQVEYLNQTQIGKKIIAVRGNCDFGSVLPNSAIFTVMGKTIFVTHGHLYNVKYRLNDIEDIAKSHNADIVLFGHTHEALSYYEDGLYVMNPGSCHGYNASFGYVDITEKGIITNTLNLP